MLSAFASVPSFNSHNNSRWKKCGLYFPDEERGSQRGQAHPRPRSAANQQSAVVPGCELTPLTLTVSLRTNRAIPSSDSLIQSPHPCCLPVNQLAKGKATHSSILAWRTPWTIVHGVAKSRQRLSNFHSWLWSRPRHPSDLSWSSGRAPLGSPCPPRWPVQKPTFCFRQ